MRRALFVIPLLLLVARPAFAHQSSVSYSTVSIGDDGVVDYTLQLSSRDLYEALALDKDRDATDEEINAGQDALFRYVLGRIRVSTPTPCPLTRSTSRILHQTDRFVELRFLARCPLPLTHIAIDYSLFFDLDRSHLGMLAVAHHGKTINRELRKGLNHFDLSLSLSAPSPSPLDQIEDGLFHPLLLLFFLLLLIPSPRRAIPLALVYCAASLLAATLHPAISPPLLTILIISSIVYVAFDDLSPLPHRPLLTAAFAFVQGLSLPTPLHAVGVTLSFLVLAIPATFLSLRLTKSR